MNPNRFSTALSDLVGNALSNAHTMLPARITSVNYDTGTASVQPLVRNYIGLNKSQDYPQLQNVPLVIMSGNAGKASVTFPISAGDTVIVMFSERDPTTVLDGNGDKPSEPVMTAPLGL